MSAVLDVEDEPLNVAPAETVLGRGGRQVLLAGSDVAAAQAAKADGFLAKPFVAADLVTRIQDLIERAAVRAADDGRR